MKAILEFDLNEFDDRAAHLRCVKATDMACALFEIANNLKKRAEHYCDNPNSEVSNYDLIEYVFSEIREELESNNINIDELLN